MQSSLKTGPKTRFDTGTTFLVINTTVFLLNFILTPLALWKFDLVLIIKPLCILPLKNLFCKRGFRSLHFLGLVIEQKLK